MALRIIPKDMKFLDLFADAGSNLAEAAAGLRDMVEHFDRIEQRIAGIQRLEKRGDQLDQEVNRRLENAFVAPFDREDIHELTVRLDDVVDYVQAVAESMVIFDVKQPTEDCRRLAQILAAQGSELAAALSKLNRMKELNEHLAKIHELEHEADGVSRAAIGRLFRDAVDPLEVIKWRELYQQMENAIDASEDAAEAIEKMIHKRV